MQSTLSAYITNATTSIDVGNLAKRHFQQVELTIPTLVGSSRERVLCITIINKGNAVDNVSRDVDPVSIANITGLVDIVDGVWIPAKGLTNTLIDGIILHVYRNDKNDLLFRVSYLYCNTMLLTDTVCHSYADYADMPVGEIVKKFAHGNILNHHDRVWGDMLAADRARYNIFMTAPAQWKFPKNFDFYPFKANDKPFTKKQGLIYPANVEEVKKDTPPITDIVADLLNPDYSPGTVQGVPVSENNVKELDSSLVVDFVNKVTAFMDDVNKDEYVSTSTEFMDFMRGFVAQTTLDQRRTDARLSEILNNQSVIVAKLNTISHFQTQPNHFGQPHQQPHYPNHPGWYQQGRRSGTPYDTFNPQWGGSAQQPQNPQWSGDFAGAQQPQEGYPQPFGPYGSGQKRQPMRTDIHPMVNMQDEHGAWYHYNNFLIRVDGKVPTDTYK